MTRRQRLKYEMFVRIRNFGAASRDVLPAESAAGKKFGQLADVVAIIEEQLVRQGQARAEACRLKLGVWDAATESLKVVAAAGRRAAIAETAPHPFRLPRRRAATVVLATARMFREEAERRQDKLEELGLPPTFMADFAKAVDDLAAAVGRQQDSRAARHKARGTIEAALRHGMTLVADLDVAVPANLHEDSGRLSEWFGARRIDQPGFVSTGAPPAMATNPPRAVETVAARATPGRPQELGAKTAA
jgi:hypothetical protein